MKKTTIGIIAHVDSGKTTLSEAILFESGVLRRFGRVDKGNSFLDDDAMERKRGITIYSKQAVFEYGTTHFTLLDTPGHADFSAEMERTLQVLDYAILLISASDGIKGQTETLWRLLNEYRIPTFIFYNKMDQPGTDKAMLLDQSHRAFSSSIVDFSADKDDAFYDNVAMCSEEAMDFFLANKFVSDEIITELISERKLFPAFFGSALKIYGVRELIENLDRYTKEKVYPERFGARVYKISRDETGKRLTLMKLTGGMLKNKSLLPDGNEDAKINQIRVYSGNKYTLVQEALAGDVVAVDGLKESFAGQGFGFESQKLMPFLMPVLSYRVLLKSGDDPVKVLPYFKTLEEESPELSVRWNEENSEISVQVMGPVQLEVLTSVLKERFRLNAAFDNGEILYKETIKDTVIGVGHFEPLRHYAEVHLKMEPLPEGSGLIFEADVSTDYLAVNWQRLILTHLAEKEHRGVLTGSPITDMKITLVAGKSHLKHTEGGDFRQATYRAVRQGLMMAENILLEPYYRFVMELPSENIGRAMSDLDRMNAEFTAPELNPERGTSVISGRVPVDAFKDYPRELAAYTKGAGSIATMPDGYSICRNAEDVILKKCYDPLSDVRNTPDSVFCSHGSGIIVPFDQVYDHMHVFFEKESSIFSEKVVRAARRRSSEEIHLGTEEVDAIISGISRSNEKNKNVTPRYKKNMVNAQQKALTDALKLKENKPRVFAPDDADYLLVDGYNVIYAWNELAELARVNLDAARDSLIETLCNYRSMTKSEIIAVFDAYRVAGHKTEFLNFQNIHIVYTKEAETADHYIERFAHDHSKRYKVAVVTSDGVEQVIIRGQGCALISSREFKERVNALSANLREIYGVKQEKD